MGIAYNLQRKCRFEMNLAALHAFDLYLHVHKVTSLEKPKVILGIAPNTAVDVLLLDKNPEQTRA